MQRQLQALRDAVRRADDERRMRDVADYATRNGFSGTATGMASVIDWIFPPRGVQGHEGVPPRAGKEDK